MNYHVLQPTVCGQFGDNTALDTSVHPPRVTNLDFVLDLPPRDDLHTAFPCFFVSGRLARRIADLGLTGASLAPVPVEMDEQYSEPHPGEPTPEVFRLEVTGPAQVADFGLNSDHSLVVSDAALAAIRGFRLDECQVYVAAKAPTPREMEDDIWAEAKRAADEIRRSLKKP